MSGFAVVVCRAGSSLPARDIDLVLESLAHRGRHGCDVRRLPGAALGHQHFWTTPEEVGESQPIRDDSGRLHLVLDGRLDNRDDLLGSLECRGSHAEISDAALLLMAYERWGTGCFQRLLGSFAAAIYDAHAQRLVCARDPVGSRTLFFFLNARVAVVASEEASVLKHPAVSTQPNEDTVAAFFSLQAPGDGSTFFRDVRELRPGHGMVVDTNGIQHWRYGDVSPRAGAPRSDSEYADRFRELLDESVRCRLRAVSPPAVMMSGGLDSTSVAAMAARQRKAQYGTEPLRSVSYVFDELSSCDERTYIDALAKRHGLQAMRFAGDQAWPLREPDTWPWNPNTPEESPYRRLKEGVYRISREHGSRTILTGQFGDQLYSGDAHWLKDLCHERRYSEAGRELWENIARWGLWRVLKSDTLRILLGVRGFGRWRARQAPWLTSRASARLPEAVEPTALEARRPEQHRNVLGPFAARIATSEIYHASCEGVELRHPYRDRRLIEFMLSVAAHQLYNRGLRKYVLRNAMDGVLPDCVRGRMIPTSAMALYRRGIAERQAADVETILHAPDAEWPRYVRRDWIGRATPGSMSSEMEELVLWRCVCFEQWRRAREGHGAAEPREGLGKAQVPVEGRLLAEVT